jgi:hypothetical protein
MAVMINDDAFARMVSEDVKNKISSIEKSLLMQPENWDRWRDTLLVLVENLDRQIDSLANDADADSERYSSMGRSGERLASAAARDYQFKIKKIDRFRFHVNRRLDEVVVMIETGTVKEEDGWERAAFLENAIYRHRSLIKEFELEETSIDKALWSALEGQWDFETIDEESI